MPHVFFTYTPTTIISLLLLASFNVTAQEVTDNATNDATAVESSPVATDAVTEDSADDSLDIPATNTPPAENTNLVRALITSAIENREPVDEIMSINKHQGRVYFFTEFSDMKGKQITHRWEYKGEIIANVNFNIGSNRWRCYSSKNILPEWTGIWTVYVVDDEGKTLKESLFEVVE